VNRKRSGLIRKVLRAVTRYKLYVVYSFNEETIRWGPYVDELKQLLVELLDVHNGDTILAGFFGVRDFVNRTFH
jgi:hypothetical protein